MALKRETDGSQAGKYSLIVLACFLLVFVSLLLWIYYRTGGIPDTLCTCVFAICGGECGVMGWIKTTKENQRERQEYLEDRQHGEELQVIGFHTGKEDL